jgi:hypothetical protein
LPRADVQLLHWKRHLQRGLPAGPERVVRAAPLSAPLAAAWLDGPACSGRAAHQG